MSTLKDRINTDLKTAMLARDELRTTTLRGLKATILNEEVAKNLREEGLGDEAIEQLLARESKKRTEAAELFERGGNQESAEKERAEKSIIDAYLPEQLDEAAVQSMVDSVIEQLKPDGMKDMGRVIGAVKAKAGNTADGSVIAKLVKNSLQ